MPENGGQEFEEVRRYLAGSAGLETDAVRLLRLAGRSAARRLGLQPADADAIGVDFAAHMLTQQAPVLRSAQGDLQAYIRQAALWYAAWQGRGRRTEARRTAALPLETAADTDVENAAVCRCLVTCIRECVARFPPEDQALYQLCLVEGLTAGEAAEALGCTPAAVRKRLERLRARLRAAFPLEEP